MISLSKTLIFSLSLLLALLSLKFLSFHSLEQQKMSKIIDYYVKVITAKSTQQNHKLSFG